MEDKTAQTDNNYYANLNRIVRFFTRTDSGYAFASIDNQRHISAINSQLKQLLVEKQLDLQFFNFDGKSGSPLVEQLQKATKPGIDALIVNNLRILAEMHDGILTEKGSNSLQELNFAREDLYNLKIPILFWASKELLSIISNRVADLYTQRSINSVFFDHYPDEAQPETDLESRFLPEYRNTPDYESLELKIKLLKKQLADAEANNYPLSRIANQLALPLAKTYSEIDLHPQATALLEKYTTSFDLQNLKTLTDIADIAKNGNQYEKAIDYYEKAIKLAGIKNEKHEISRSYSKLGDIYQSLGDWDKALEYFNDYNQLGKELYGANPNSEYLKNGLAISYERLGDIYKLLGDLDKALEFFSLFNELSKELYKANPKSEILKNNLAISYSKLGGIYQSLGDLDKALDFFNLDIELSKELYKANPKSENLKNGLAVSYEKLGAIYQSLGDLVKALEFFNLRSKLGKELYGANPKSQNLKNGLAISYSKLGIIYQSLGDLDKALEYFNLDIELSKELYKANPKSENLKNGLAISYAKLGGIYLIIELVHDSKVNFDLCKELYIDLVKSNPLSIINQSNYAEISAITAIFELKMQSDYQTAINALKESVLSWQKLYKQTGMELFSKKIALVEQYQQGICSYKETIIKLTQE